MPRIDYARLVEGIRSARRVMQADRDARVKLIEAYQGKNSPVNMLELFMRIVTRSLVAKEPRFHFSTFIEQLRPSMHTMELWYNEEVQRQYLADTLQRCVYDALMKIGIAKVALAHPGDVALRGYEIEVAEPIVSAVDFDDYVYDVRATSLEAPSFAGHRFKLPLEVARQMSMYGPGRKQLQATTNPLYNAEGDLRATAIDRLPYYTDWEEWVELWEIWLPRHGVVVTLPDDSMAGVSIGPKDEPLRVQKWIGPPCGPYHYLPFGPVPGQALPKGAMVSLRLIDESINKLYRKLMRQAERQKKNTLVQAQNDKDNIAYKNANDGDIIPCDKPDAFVEVNRGGPDKNNDAFAMELRQVFSFLAGNLETMGGLVPQAKTARQEEMLNENSSATLADMQDATLKFSASIADAQTWFYWYHPTKTMQTMYSVPGMPEFSVPLTLTPQQRHQFNWNQMRRRIDPYSMKYRSPEQVINAITKAVMGIFVPLQPLMAQNGISLNLQRFAQMYGEYQDIPEFAEIIETAAPQPVGSGPDDSPGQGQPPSQPGQQANRSEATQAGQDGAIRQALLGQDAGGAQAFGGNGGEDGE